MKFPRHFSLTLSHNDHKSNYMTVAEHSDVSQFEPHEWVNEDQRQQAIETGELWQLQWYPDTPVGFCRKLAADLGVLLEWAENSNLCCGELCEGEAAST